MRLTTMFFLVFSITHNAAAFQKAAAPSSEEPSSIAEAIEWLGSSKYPRREAASKQFVEKWKRSALPELVRALSHWDEEVKKRAVFAIKDIDSVESPYLNAKLRKQYNIPNAAEQREQLLAEGGMALPKIPPFNIVEVNPPVVMAPADEPDPVPGKSSAVLAEELRLLREIATLAGQDPGARQQISQILMAKQNEVSKKKRWEEKRELEAEPIDKKNRLRLNKVEKEVQEEMKMRQQMLPRHRPAQNPMIRPGLNHPGQATH